MRTIEIACFIIALCAFGIGFVVGFICAEARKPKVDYRKLTEDPLRLAVNALAAKHGHSDVMSWPPLCTIEMKLEACDRLLALHGQPETTGIDGKTELQRGMDGIER
jgi:hypothetical protein